MKRVGVRTVQTTLAPILDVLDEGSALYRRHFPRMLLLAAIAAFPVGIIGVAAVVADDWLAGLGGTLAVISLVLLALPLSLYSMAALSRAAELAAKGERVALRRTLALGPLRLLGMGCYGILFLMAAGMVVSAFSVICLCSAYGMWIAAIAAGDAISSLGGVVGEAAVIGLALAGLVALLALYVVLLVMNGATYGSAIFAMQPFVHDPLPFGKAVQQSLDLMFYRLGSNLLAFFCTSLVFGAITLAATLALGVLVPLPVLFFLGAESTLAQAITAAVWVAAISAATPLLPIWMALLYRRRLMARQGDDLAARIAQLMPADGQLGRTSKFTDETL